MNPRTLASSLPRSKVPSLGGALAQSVGTNVNKSKDNTLLLTSHHKCGGKIMHAFGSPVPVSPFDLVSRRPRTFRAEKPGFPLSSRNDWMKMSFQCQPLRLFVSTQRGCKSLKPRFVMVDVAEEMRGRQSVITGVWARKRVITDVEEALCATFHTVSCSRFSIYSFRVLEPWC